MRGERRVPPSPCPCCAAVLDMSGDVFADGPPAGPGDFTLCVECAAILVFGSDMQLRVPRRSEVARLSPAHCDQLQAARRILLQLHARDGKPPPPRGT